ncbi:hypothetical protein TUM19329_28310 [Legionella antarctica]|uniref:Uncharacterized protein n=1 Tax=Legionella antarctica TaxID=2708020 RepID=A0A6F8T8J0_9GAMM|nr:hypothetical protein [Legionella antarctica]BCA96470.1 hypothetical protein TUM19329_28310 [Legionella antarctica]
MMQRVLLVLLFFCSFLVSADDTVLKLYRPYGEVTDQTVPVVKNKISGQCTTQSQLILREDAWRCMADGKIFDPCFVKPSNSKTEVICPQSPWVSDSVQIEVGSPLENENHVTLDMSRVYPWGIELANGEHCEAIEPNEVYDSMPVRYRCSNQNILIGHLQRCKATWSMLAKTSEGIVTVYLKKAWF